MRLATGIFIGASSTALAAYATGGTWRTLFMLGLALPILAAIIYPRRIASFLNRIAAAKDAFGGNHTVQSVGKVGKPQIVPPTLSKDEIDAVSALVNLGQKEDRATKAVLGTRGKAKGVIAIVALASRRAA